MNVQPLTVNAEDNVLLTLSAPRIYRASQINVLIPAQAFVVQEVIVLSLIENQFVNVKKI